MRILPRAVAPLLLVLCLLATAGAGEKSGNRHYVCSPCGMPCDKTVYDKPGNCPVCGARLVDQEEAARPRTRVAILIFNGVEIIDFAGPWEVFGAAGFDVVTVAESRQPVTTSMGMAVVPGYTFADAPPPDILLVPGGAVGGPRGSAATLKWVTGETARAKHTLSVCNGAFILAGAGLLEGLSATTTAGQIERLKAEYPGIRVVDNQRFVDNGKIITTAGLSAGIDGALHVVARMLGEGAAQAVALNLEYDWRPRSGFARAALADRLIPDLDLDEVGAWSVVSTEGGTDRWEIVVRATPDHGLPEVMAHFSRALESRGKWTRVRLAAPPASPPWSGEWRFVGPDGAPWSGTFGMEPPARDGQVLLKVGVRRMGDAGSKASS